MGAVRSQPLSWNPFDLGRSALHEHSPPAELGSRRMGRDQAQRDLDRQRRQDYREMNRPINRAMLASAPAMALTLLGSLACIAGAVFALGMGLMFVASPHWGAAELMLAGIGV